MSYTPTEWESTDVVTATRMNALEQAVGDMNMSYTPNTWSDGDILSAEKMNALEQAVASGGGGSSDFSTAEVTFIIENGASATTTNLFIVMGQVGERYLVYREEMPFSAGIATLPLVDGYSSFGIVPESGVVVTVSGNAEYYSEDEEIGITGDCTITVS